MDREARKRIERFVAPLHAARLESSDGSEHGVSELTVAEAPQQCVSLQPRTVARLTGRIRAIARQQHAHVHLVGFGLQPGEKALRAVPDTLVPVSLALDDPFATFGPELAPRSIHGNAPLLRILEQIVLTFLVGLGLPGLDGAAAQRLTLIRNDQAIVDADGPPESAATLAGAHGRVQREQAGIRLAVRQIALGAVQLTGIPPGLERSRRIRVVDHLSIDPALSNTQRR